MEINKNIRTGQPKVDEYISYLENHILEFDASNIKKLIMACDEVVGIVADDIILLKENSDDDEIDNKLQMMGSKKNKIYQRYREVVSDLKHFKTLSDMVAELKPKVSIKESKSTTEPKTTEIQEVKPKVKRNIQDFALNNES